VAYRDSATSVLPVRPKQRPLPQQVPRWIALPVEWRLPSYQWHGRERRLRMDEVECWGGGQATASTAELGRVPLAVQHVCDPYLSPYPRQREYQPSTCVKCVMTANRLSELGSCSFGQTQDPRNMSQACLDIIANKEIIALSARSTYLAL
jgi:hypothetical protein